MAVGNCPWFSGGLATCLQGTLLLAFIWTPLCGPAGFRPSLPSHGLVQIPGCLREILTCLFALSPAPASLLGGGEKEHPLGI